MVYLSVRFSGMQKWYKSDFVFNKGTVRCCVLHFRDFIILKYGHVLKHIKKELSLRTVWNPALSLYVLNLKGWKCMSVLKALKWDLQFWKSSVWYRPKMTKGQRAERPKLKEYSRETSAQGIGTDTLIQTRT